MIYVCRNVKDAAVSLYYHQQLRGFCGTFPQFAELFKAGNLMYNPFFDHILGAWKHSDRSNLFFATFEEMKADLPKVIRNMATFMGKPLTAGQLDRIVQLVDIETFRTNKYAGMKRLNNSND